jgi:hypothetical protein
MRQFFMSHLMWVRYRFLFRAELTDLPTDTLLDIVFVILTGGQPLTLSEVGELEQIQRELQRRGELEGARLCQTAIGLRNL